MMQSVKLGQKQFQQLKMNSDSNPTFKNGQILYGKINKWYPNQMAEVQIGNQKVVANVDVPLQTGERYLFQVQQNIGNILLKVLDSEADAELNGKSSATAQQIVSHLGVSKSNEATELVEFLMKNQLPIKKDTFQLAMQWLKQVDSPKEGLMAIKTMYTQQLPFIEDVFNALFTQAKGESFHGMLQQLLTSINSSATKTETTTQLKTALESLIASKQGRIQELGLQKLISYWLNPNSSSDIKEGAFSLLQKTGFISLVQTYLEVQDRINSQNSSVTLGKRDVVDQKVLQGLKEFNTAMLNTSGEYSKLLEFVNNNGEQVRQAKDVLTNQFLVFSQNRTQSQLLPNERAVLQLLSSEWQMPDMTNPAVVSSQLKDVAKLLGLQFEHVLANTQTLNSAQLKEELTTLKPLLLTLLHEQQPATVKELADQIVNRITAQQIISQENGPIQNLLLTLPLNMGNYETDITLQWSGRKRKDGSIDPDYCRILFYLDLEQLQETLIDMQVQNRVIKISVLNERSEWIQDLAEPFIHTLREKLEEMDYKLSGILFENTVKKQIVENKQQLLYQTDSSYSGVDVRI